MRSLYPALLVALASLPLGACAKSDAITETSSGGTGGYDFEDDDDGVSEEAGPEAGVGAFGPTGVGGDGGSSGDGGDGGEDPGQGGSSASGASCGDGTCQVANGEDCDTCPGDCGGSCGPSCGDGVCDPNELCDVCEDDCGICPVCGDGTCQDPEEDCDSCYQDCGICACAPDDFEVNNTSPNATNVSLNTEYADLSICSGDVDWFEFTVNGTRTITLRFNQAEGDLDLEIFSVATVDYVTGSYSHDDDEQVTLTGQPSGAYWARVYGYAGATNPDYSLEVED